MGLSKSEATDVEEALTYLNKCTSNSAACIKFILQKPQFKNFVLASAKQAPKVLEPLLKEASIACTAAREKLNEADKVKKKATEEDKAARKAMEDDRAAREQSRQESIRKRQAEFLEKHEAAKRAKHSETVEASGLNGAEVDQGNASVPSSTDGTHTPAAEHSALSQFQSPYSEVQTTPEIQDLREASSAPSPESSVSSTTLLANDHDQITAEKPAIPVRLAGEKSSTRDSTIELPNPLYQANAPPGMSATDEEILHSPGSSGSGLFITDQETVENQDTVSPPTGEVTSDIEDRMLQPVKSTAIPKPEMNSETEKGLFSGAPEILDQFRAQCRSWSYYGDRDRQMDDVFFACRRLGLNRNGKKLSAYLSERPSAQDSNNIEIPTTWTMDNAKDLVNAIQQIRNSDEHAKIHKAFAQMRLYDIVQKQVKSGLVKIKTKSKRVAKHLVVLDDMARAKVPTASETRKDQVSAEHQRAYHAGKRWVDVCQSFGGSSTVLVFVTSGIGSSYIDSSWVKFQFDVLAHVALFLPSIQGLIHRLGSEALEIYCRQGNFTSELKSRIPDPDVEDDEPAQGASDSEEDETWVEGEEENETDNEGEAEDENEAEKENRYEGVDGEVVFMSD